MSCSTSKCSKAPAFMALIGCLECDAFAIRLLEERDDELHERIARIYFVYHSIEL